jgi:outer membrane receptor protein involved in Fe transport
MSLNSIRAAVASILLLGTVLAEPACASEPAHFSIAAKPLAEALMEFGSQAGKVIVAPSELTTGKMAKPLEGRMEPELALKQLLEGTGLQYRAAPDGAIVIVRSEPAANTENAPRPELRVAQADANMSSRAEESAQVERVELQEIVVTAQKREERLIDTPQSVSVISGADLARLGAVQFRDYANTIPGLTFTTTGAGSNQLALRGVTTGVDNNPTVGVYLDDVPIGSSTAFGFGARLALDAGLFDLNRIEVLRGPQGTLYGASTMGGLLKYVTNAPNTSAFSADAQAGVSSTASGDLNYNGALAVNVPLGSDIAALRGTAFFSRDGGYTDNVALRRKDVNRADIYGGRVKVLLKPTEALGIEIGALLQNISRDGQSSSDYAFNGSPVTGELEQSRPIAEPWDQRLRLVSGKLDYRMGPVTLTSISAYQEITTETVFDVSALFVPILGLFERTYTAVGLPDRTTTDKFTQEIRLASSSAAPLEWLIGGYYAHENSRVSENMDVRGPGGVPMENDVYTFSNPTRYEEYAAFVDFTYHFTDRLDATLGTRYAKNNQVFTQLGSGLLGSSTPTLHSSEDVFTYLANVRYRFNAHSNLYARYATGYRPGGSNFVGFDPDAPAQFESDRLKSYEVGYKVETADRRFGADLAAYFIDWDNIQLSRALGGFDNAGAAAVKGLELGLVARPVPRLSLSGAFAYQDPYLREPAVVQGGLKGERLPNVAHFTGSLSADYQLADGSARPTIGLTARHVSERMASFDASPRFPQFRLPAYTTLDLRGSVDVNKISLQLYVHNLFDERGELSTFNGYSTFGGPAQVSIMQPRTIGISATTHF